MRSIVLVAASAAVVAGCWLARPTTRVAIVTGPVPGTLWVTPTQPWRVPMRVDFVAASGDAVLLADGGGRIGRLDRVTGQLVREGQLDRVELWDVLALPDGQWIAVGIKDERAVAMSIDRETLVSRIVVAGEAKQVAPGTYVGTSAGAAIVDDGIAIAGLGLPLAIYDPATWKVRRVVDPALGWRRLRGSGTTLYATGLGDAGRFDLATGRFDLVTWEDARAGVYTARRTAERGVVGIEIDADGRRVAHVPGGSPMALDAASGRLATRVNTRIVVYRLTDGEPLASYSLGEFGYGDWHALAFVGSHLLVSVDSVVRMIGADSPAFHARIAA